eukprot:353536-Chlamydomonas_euryale.AAC.1
MYARIAVPAMFSKTCASHATLPVSKAASRRCAQSPHPSCAEREVRGGHASPHNSWRSPSPVVASGVASRKDVAKAAQKAVLGAGRHDQHLLSHLAVAVKNALALPRREAGVKLQVQHRKMKLHMCACVCVRGGGKMCES